MAQHADAINVAVHVVCCAFGSGRTVSGPGICPVLAGHNHSTLKICRQLHGGLGVHHGCLCGAERLEGPSHAHVLT